MHVRRRHFLEIICIICICIEGAVGAPKLWLFFDLIQSERHGGQFITDYQRVLGSDTLEGAGLGGDALGLVEGVLIVHRAAPAQGDSLGGAVALDALQVEGDRLWLLGGVDDLDDDLASGLVEDARCEESVLSFLSGYGLLVHQQGEYVSAFVLGVELLYVVADALEHAEVVVPDHIWTPLPALDMGEEGSVGGHLYDVGIALDTCHEGSLVE